MGLYRRERELEKTEIQIEEKKGYRMRWKDGIRDWREGEWREGRETGLVRRKRRGVGEKYGKRD
jgi:hypothetical protein